MIPVITYISGGSAECIIEGKNGYAVKCGDVEELIRLVEVVQTNGKQRYSLFCRNYAENNYDMRYCYAEYLSIYEKLLHKQADEGRL